MRQEASMSVEESKLRAMRRIFSIATFGYLFFLAIELIGRGMKTSFAAPLKAYLEGNGKDLGELGSFVIGILGTALVQSSSTVTSMSVVLTSEGVIPLLVAVGIVHGANLGTSVTSSVVAFAAETRPATGRFFHDLKTLLFAPRAPGFRRAVGTAVVHDMFNIILVTSILLVLELPFGIVVKSAQASADVVARVLHSSAWIPEALGVVSPATYTKPVVKFLLDLGAPGWALALAGLPLLFYALKGFASRMKQVVLAGVDTEDMSAIGETLLGKTPFATFMRGLVITILVQSSSATTSMVVPLAAMGFFGVRKVFPFIMGANIGTTTTALLAASASLGAPGFHEGMTIALSHLYLNVLAVVLVVTVPGLMQSVLGSADWLSRRAAETPAVLLVYLAVLAVVVPLVALMLPTAVAAVVIGSITTVMVVGPNLRLGRQKRGLAMAWVRRPAPSAPLDD